MRSMLAVVVAAGGLGVLGPTWAGWAQPGAAVSHPVEPVVIVPQGRHVVIMPTPRPATVSLTSVSADVKITDQVASTTLTMTLTNPGGSAQEAQLLVPVPDGASVRAFQLDSAGPEPTAKVLPRDEARRIYDAIVAKSRDPGLLEFVGYGVIRSSVFPVPAGGTQTLRLTYEQLLPADGSNAGDRVDYVLPRTESLEQTGVQWTFAAEIRSKRPISTVYSPSHEIVTERVDAEHVRVKLMTGSLAQPGSFRLSYLLQRDGDDPAASVMFYPDPEIGDGKGGYFLLLTGLPARSPDAEKALKREVTVVIDRSGSMRGEKMDQAREAALQVVEGLREGEYFNIIDYSDSIASFSERPVEKTAETIGKAREYLKGIRANGGTNIHDAVVEALRQDPTPGTLPVVLFLTDGLPTVGQTSEKDIKAAASKANRFERRIFTFGVGFDVNAPLLRGLAVETRAASTFVLPEENVEVKVGQAFRKLSGPVMAAPRLSASGADAARAIREVQPAALPDLFDGDQLIVLGQYTEGTARSLVLEGNFLGKPRAFEFAFDPSKATTRNAFVPRLWASRKIASLIEQIRQNGANWGGSDPAKDPKAKELVDEIVRLSTKWGILTEYTAFLALEPGAMAASPGGLPQRELDLAFKSSSGEGRALDQDAAARSANLDVLGGAPAAAEAAPPGERMRSMVGYIVQQRAETERAGKIAVNQDMNLGVMTMQSCTNPLNEFYTKDMQRVQVMAVCQVADQSLFRRGGRWVDGRLLGQEKEAPEQVIEFGSDEYRALVDELAAQGRQGLLAQGGDCYLLHQGRRVLVKGPGTTTE